MKEQTQNALVFIVWLAWERDYWTLEIDIGKQPSKNMVDLTKFPKSEKIWSPILPFHLQNVNICTLHAEIRI